MSPADCACSRATRDLVEVLDELFSDARLAGAVHCLCPRCRDVGDMTGVRRLPPLRLTAGVEPFRGILAQRLQQPVPGLARRSAAW